MGFDIPPPGTAFFPPLCGVPGVCGESASLNCPDVSMNSCLDCSPAVSGVFVCIISLLGLAILGGNSLVIIIFCKLRKKQEASKADICKVSLAASDLITGLLIFIVAIPNFARALHAPPAVSVEENELYRNSPEAIAGSFFYLFSYTSSLYHLFTFGLLRLYAILRPYNYRLLSNRATYVALVLTWFAAGAIATMPSWVPEYFSYNYNHVVFFYLPSLNEIPSDSSSVTYAVLSAVLVLGLPFLLMTAISITTAILVRMRVRSSQKRLNSHNQGISKQEIGAFKTVATMQLGFTSTLVPVGVVACLLYAGLLECRNLSAPFLICFYLSLSNSLVNVLVYSIREKRFRSSVIRIFSRTKSFFSLSTNESKQITSQQTSVQTPFTSKI